MSDPWPIDPLSVMCMLYITDTNRHAFRVENLDTGETAALVVTANNES